MRSSPFVNLQSMETGVARLSNNWNPRRFRRGGKAGGLAACSVLNAVDVRPGGAYKTGERGLQVVFGEEVV